MASTESLAARLAGVVGDLFPGDDALVVERARRATTADGRVRADRVVGRLPAGVLGALDAESVGLQPLTDTGSGNVQDALLETAQVIEEGAFAVGDTTSVSLEVIPVGLIDTIFAAANFGGSGSAETAARSDHHHAGVYGPVPFGATASLNFGSIAAQTCAQLTVPVAGVVLGDALAVGVPSSLTNGLAATVYVSAADVVTVRLCNVTTSAIDPPAGNWRVRVIA